MPEATHDAAVRRFGAFEINLETGELRKHGLRLRLSGQPFRVLAVLVEHAGEVVSREELQAELWPVDTFVDFDHGLNNAVARIREVLEDSSDTPRYVETLPRRGYRFIAPLTGARTAIVSLPTVETKETLSQENPPPEPEGDSDLRVNPLTMGQRLAGFRRPVLLVVSSVAVCVAAGLWLYRSGMNSAGLPAIRSIAVLPLQNLSGDPAQEYLADGMTEELIGRLAGIHDLRVISRTSVTRFKDTKLSAPEIAQTLRVDALVEGSVARQGEKIRVHAQLIRGAADEHFWSESYDRDIGDVLALQSDVAQAIAEKIEVTVTGQEHSRLVAARHVSPDVYESYLKGAFGTHNTRADFEESVRYFEEAIRKDPTFAPAHLGLASAYGSLSLILVGAPPAEMRPKVIHSALRALELDPGLAEAHVLVADVYQKRWQWSEAEAEYKRALQLKPNDAGAHVGFANWLLCRGRTEEAIAWARRARELDPLGGAGVSLSWILFQSRHYDEAITELRSAIAVHPQAAMAHYFLGFALIGKGQPEKAILEFEKTTSLMDRSPGSVELLATAYGYAGRRTEALGLIDELKRRQEKSYIPPGAFINPYLAVRDYNSALFWFERAYTEQSNILQFVKVHPFFDPLRSNPRFQDLVRRVGLQ